MGCKIEGCDNKNVVAHGLCRKHYTRWKRHGDTDVVVKNGWKYKRKDRKSIEFAISNNGCFNCTSHCLDKDGYPQYWAYDKSYRMHRYIYEECFGFISDELVIRHKCDNPSCINPEHLEIGTWQDNMNDKVKRGRAYSGFGEKNPNAKLTELDVLMIKEKIANGISAKEIAKEYSVIPKTIRNIKNKKRWRYL